MWNTSQEIPLKSHHAYHNPSELFFFCFTSPITVNTSEKKSLNHEFKAKTNNIWFTHSSSIPPGQSFSRPLFTFQSVLQTDNDFHHFQVLLHFNRSSTYTTRFVDDQGQRHQQPAEPTLVDLHVILLGTWKNARVCTERSTKSFKVHTLSALDVVSLPESRRCPKTRPFGLNSQSTVIRMVSLGDGARTPGRSSSSSSFWMCVSLMKVFHAKWRWNSWRLQVFICFKHVLVNFYKRQKRYNIFLLLFVFNPFNFTLQQFRGYG